MRSASGSVGHSQGSSSSGVPVMHVEGRLRMVETMCGRTDTLCDRLEQVVEIHRQAIERLNAGAAEQKVLLEKRQPVSAARLDDLHDAVQKQDRQHRGSMAALLERVDAVERHHRSLDELHRRVAQYEKQNKAMYAEVLDRVESVESFKKSVGDVYKAIDAKDASQRTAYRTLAERVDSVEHSASNILDVRESLEKHERSVKASVRGLSERVEALEHREAAVDALNERMYQVDKAAKTALGDVKDRLGDLETSLTGLTEETVKVMVGRVEKVEKKVDVLTRQQDADRDAVVEWKDVQGEAARRLQVDVKTAEASARQCHVDTTELTAHVQSFTTLRQDVELLAAKLKEETPKRESAVVAMTARLDSMEETVSEHSIVLAAASGATASTLSAPPSMTSSIDAPRQLGFVGLNLSDTTQNAAAQRGKHKLVCGLVNNMEVVALKQSVTALAQHVEALDTKLHGYVEAGLAGLAKKVEKTVATMLGTSVEACDKQAVAAEAKMAASLDGINQRVEQRLRNAEACAEERFARTKTALQEVSGLFDAARAEVAAVAERLDAASPTRHRFITALDSRVTTVVGKLEKLETALQESTRSAAPARITTVDAAAQQQLLQSLATRCSFIERTIRSLQDQITDTRNAAMLLGPAGGLRSGSATPTNGAGRSTSQLSEPRRHISITPTESSVLGSVRGAATVKYDFPSAFAPETAPLTSNSTSTPSASTMNGDRVGSPLRSAAKPFVDLLDGLQEADDKRRGSLGLARCPSLRSLIGRSRGFAPAGAMVVVPREASREGSKEMPWRPPVLVVIGVGMLLSVCASMAGGLVLYFESLKSLEESVREMSEYELHALATEIGFTVKENQGVAAALRMATVHDTTSYGSLSEYHAALHDRIHGFVFPMMMGAGIYSAGLLAFPHRLGDPNVGDPNVFYSVLWSDRNEPRHGKYDTDSVNQTNEAGGALLVANETYVENWTIKTDRLNATTGVNMGYLYEWSAHDYLNEAKVDNLTDVDVDVHGWRSGIIGADAVRRRQPGVWKTKEGIYAFCMIDYMFQPPPPPHPLSRYESLLYTVGFLYASWEQVIREYHKNVHSGSHVIVADSRHDLVYATTTGENILNPSCDVHAFSLHSSPCFLRVSMMSDLVQALFASMDGLPDGVFRRWSHGDEDYFKRKMKIPYAIIDVELLWVRPVSSVESKVHSALVLLFIFTALVMAFDIIIAVLEVVLIARPILALSTSIVNVGYMRLEEARRNIQPYHDTGYTVRELQVLLGGTMETITVLSSFRSFLPSVVLLDGDEGAMSDDLPTQPSREIENLPSPTVELSAENAPSSPSSSSTRSQTLDVLSSCSSGRGSEKGSEKSDVDSLRNGRMPVNPLVVSTIIPVPSRGGSESDLKRKARVGRFELGLTQRRFTLVTVVMESMRQTSSLSAGKDLTFLLQQHAHLLELVIACAKDSGAVVDGLQGDRLSVALNAHSRCTGHREAGILCALAIHEKASMQGVHLGLTTGQGWVGNMGCDSLKKFNILSNAVAAVGQYATLAARWGLDTLLPQGMLGSGGEYEYRALHEVVANGKRSILCELLGVSADHKTEEWMYQMDRAGQSAWRHLDAALVALFAGDLVEAKSHLRRATAATSPTNYAFGSHAQNLQDCICAGEVPAPLCLDIPDAHKNTMQYINADKVPVPACPASSRAFV